MDEVAMTYGSPSASTCREPITQKLRGMSENNPVWLTGGIPLPFKLFHHLGYVTWRELYVLFVM